MLKTIVEKFEKEWHVEKPYFVWCELSMPHTDGFEWHMLAAICGKLDEAIKLYESMGGKILFEEKTGHISMSFLKRKDAVEFKKKFDCLFNDVNFDDFQETLQKYDGTLKSIGIESFFKNLI